MRNLRSSRRHRAGVGRSAIDHDGAVRLGMRTQQAECCAAAWADWRSRRDRKRSATASDQPAHVQCRLGHMHTSGFIVLAPVRVTTPVTR